VSLESSVAAGARRAAPRVGGVDQAVAMRIMGHKMASVFQRYRIVADDNVRAALELKTPTSWSAATYREVHAPSRAVSLIKEASEGGRRLELLRSIPEREIKTAIEEIIHEGRIPNDWAVSAEGSRSSSSRGVREAFLPPIERLLADAELPRDLGHRSATPCLP
jgi:hypothetical protein